MLPSTENTFHKKLFSPHCATYPKLSSAPDSILNFRLPSVINRGIIASKRTSRFFGLRLTLLTCWPFLTCLSAMCLMLYDLLTIGLPCLTNNFFFKLLTFHLHQAHSLLSLLVVLLFLLFRTFTISCTALSVVFTMSCDRNRGLTGQATMY